MTYTMVRARQGMFDLTYIVHVVFVFYTRLRCGPEGICRIEILTASCRANRRETKTERKITERERESERERERRDRGGSIIREYYISLKRNSNNTLVTIIIL
jgi:hypothetical protein